MSIRDLNGWTQFFFLVIQFYVRRTSLCYTILWMRCKLKSYVHLRYEVLAGFWQRFGMVGGAVWLLNDGVLSARGQGAVRFVCLS